MNDSDEDVRWIEAGLTSSFERLDVGAAPSDARYTKLPRRGWRLRALPWLGIPAALSGHFASAAVVITLVAATGVAAKGATTGDPNPFHWGATVTQAVQTCKADPTPGQHGIGQCVSAQATQNGQSQRDNHPTLGTAAGTGNSGGNGAGNGAGNGNGPPASPGKPSALPGGRPSQPPAEGKPSLPPGQGSPGKKLGWVS